MAVVLIDLQYHPIYLLHLSDSNYSFFLGLERDNFFLFIISWGSGQLASGRIKKHCKRISSHNL